MGKRTQVRIRGTDELERRLRRIPDAIGGRHLVEATEQGAEITRSLAADLAPRRTGESAKHIGTERAKQGPTRAEVNIGYEPEGYRLIFQELGTAHHPAQPHLVPALEHTQRDVADEIGDELRKRLLKAART
jgi:HK97 gp10 family phage protein